MITEDESAVRALYERLLTAWNQRDAGASADCFWEDGETIGFDGSELSGRKVIAAEFARIFSHHPTGRYVAKVRGVRALGDEVAVLHAVAGMVPAGQAALEPRLHAVQALTAHRRAGTWRAALYQNTPAQWHGRPEDVAKLTAELSKLL